MRFTQLCLAAMMLVVLTDLPASAQPLSLTDRVKQLEDSLTEVAVAHREAISSLKSEVAALKAEVKELKRQLATTVASPAWTPADNPMPPTYTTTAYYSAPPMGMGMGVGACANGRCSPGLGGLGLARPRGEPVPAGPAAPALGHGEGRGRRAYGHLFARHGRRGEGPAAGRPPAVIAGAHAHPMPI